MTQISIVKGGKEAAGVGSRSPGAKPVKIEIGGSRLGKKKQREKNMRSMQRRRQVLLVSTVTDGCILIKGGGSMFHQSLASSTHHSGSIDGLFLCCLNPILTMQGGHLFVLKQGETAKDVLGRCQCGQEGTLQPHPVPPQEPHAHEPAHLPPAWEVNF